MRTSPRSPSWRLAAFRNHDLEPCVYVDWNGDGVDVILPPEPSTCSAHVENQGRIARARDLDGVVALPGVYSFSVLGRDRAMLSPLVRDLADLGAEFTLFPEPRFGGWGIVVAPPGVTKWNGVMAWCTSRGIDAHEVLAVGDGDNDVDMLTRAGRGVAVRGGTTRALAAAEHLIDPPQREGWTAILDLVV